MSILRISLSSGLTFDERPLPLKARWLEVYTLLALRFLEGHAGVSPVDMNALPSWRGTALSSIRSGGLWRAHREQKQRQGPALLKACGSGCFALDNAHVSQVVFAEPLEQVRRFLGLDGPLVRVSQDLGQALALRQAWEAFEHGQMRHAQSLCSPLLMDHTPKELHLEAACLDLWCEAFGGLARFSAGQHKFAALKRRVARWQKRGEALAPERLALLWIQAGRTELLRHRFSNPVTPALLERVRPAGLSAYREAEKLLEPHHHREWSAIEAGRGYFALVSGQLDAAQAHYRRSIAHALLCNWSWSVQVQLCNLGEVWHQRALRCSPGSTEALACLQEEYTALMQADELCQLAGFAGSIELELQLMRYCREYGTLEDVKKWMTHAIKLVKKSENSSEFIALYEEIGACMLAGLTLSSEEQSSLFKELEQARRQARALKMGEKADHIVALRKQLREGLNA